MRTWKITISPKHKKDAVLCEYMADTTTDARCFSYPAADHWFLSYETFLENLITQHYNSI